MKLRITKNCLSYLFENWFQGEVLDQGEGGITKNEKEYAALLWLF